MHSSGAPPALTICTRMQLKARYRLASALTTFQRVDSHLAELSNEWMPVSITAGISRRFNNSAGSAKWITRLLLSYNVIAYAKYHLAVSLCNIHAMMEKLITARRSVVTLTRMKTLYPSPFHIFKRCAYLLQPAARLYSNFSQQLAISQTRILS